MKLWLKQWMTLSCKGLRHLLWDFGQSLGIWFYNCNPLLICWVTLKRFKIHKSCSSNFWCLLHLNNWLKHSRSLAHRNRASGRSDGGKAYLYGSMRFLYLTFSSSCLQMSPKPHSYLIPVSSCVYLSIPSPCDLIQRTGIWWELLKGKWSWGFIDPAWAGVGLAGLKSSFPTQRVLWFWAILLPKAAAMLLW